MTAPFTLRQLLGLPAAPAPLSQSVLILVDVQNTYLRGTMRLDGVEAALEECVRLLTRARAAGVPVIHIQHDAGPGTPYDIRAEIGAIADPVAPLAGEPVVVKRHANAFIGTELEAHLRALGAPRQLVVAGFMTHNCVNSTARGAVNLGWPVVVPAAATATRALPAPGGGTVPAAEVQRANLAGLSDAFAVVVAGGDDIPA
ncbi:cysteine hydrolase family protein [Zoogloea sp.]|uniref:cysteine hydrolase family protein n=1 Tax=Zoogloea sp. TaxID=49181 RepID=UPI0035B15885